MRGSLKQRSKGSWSIILDLGYEVDPATGRQKRKQRWQTVRGTRKEAEDKLTELLKEAKDGTCIDPSKLTLADWLREWLAASKKQFRENTITRYEGIIERNLIPSAIGPVLLQKLRSTHLEAYYAGDSRSVSTLNLHHAILHRALRKAKKDGLIKENVAADLDSKPKVDRRSREGARKHCWTAGEARGFLQAAQTRGLQAGAFYALALDSGARKGELCGVTWPNLDLEEGKFHIVQQLLKPGPEPVFGPPKTGRPRRCRCRLPRSRCCGDTASNSGNCGWRIVRTTGITVWRSQGMGRPDPRESGAGRRAPDQ